MWSFLIPETGLYQIDRIRSPSLIPFFYSPLQLSITSFCMSTELCSLLQGLMCDVNMPEGTNYLPIVHVYGFSKADDPAMDVKSR
jgi:hypothetical protein